MSLKTLFLAALFFVFSGISFPETGTFDRIVLKDMTVIKASLVKEEGDSLAYFELDDPDFIKRKVAKDQVFKWVKAAAAQAGSAQPQKSAMPRPDTALAKTPPPPPPPVVAKDTFPDNIPVADYQAISARLDSIERSKYRQMAGFEDTTPAPVPPPPAGPAKINAAVYGLTGKGLGKSSAGINATAQMRTELSNTGVFRIMDRAEMEKILKDKAFKIKGACDDPACLAEVGRVLGVDRILSGSVTNEGRVWTFSLSMIDAGTGEVLVTVTEHYEGWIKKDVVPEVTASLARQMADKVTNKAVAVIAPAAGTAAAPSAALEYDTSEAVPEGLTQVRLDPPTGTEGMKIVPRSGMAAININPSFTSLGLGFRSWSAGGFGFAAGGAVMWGGSSGFSVKAQPMLALNARSKSRVRWYLFPMIGYQWITIETESMSFMGVTTPSTSTDISLMNYVLGLGAEWRVGINRNHGLAAEVGYQGGEGTYETEPYTLMGTTIDPGEQTYEPVPFYLMFSYAYYF